MPFRSQLLAVPLHLHGLVHHGRIPGTLRLHKQRAAPLCQVLQAPAVIPESLFMGIEQAQSPVQGII